MVRKLSVLAVIVCGLVLSSGPSVADISLGPVQDNATRVTTVMIYAAGDGNLESAVLLNINNIESCLPAGDVEVIMLLIAPPATPRPTATGREAAYCDCGATTTATARTPKRLLISAR